MENGLKTSPVDDKQLKKVSRDLHFIDLLTELAKKNNMRIIVHGGYAVDGFFQRITRPHNDVDLGVWGNKPDGLEMIKQLVVGIGKEVPEFNNLSLEDKGRNDWTHRVTAKKDDFIAEMYYAQVDYSPFDSEKRIIKKDGTVDAQQHQTQTVTLAGVTFEATTPLLAIVDRLYKQKRGDGIKTPHTQDIENLRLITNQEEVRKRLETYTGG